MANWVFNPFTDELDYAGSGGGSTSYLDGDVEFHGDLPVTLGAPGVNAAFLVRKGSGIYFFTRKPAGIWVRELNNGNLDDWKYAGTFSDLYRDVNFRIINDTDTSKEVAFSASSVPSGSTVTLTVPEMSGIISLEGHTHTPNEITSFVQNISGQSAVVLDAALYSTFVIEVTEPLTVSFENFTSGRSIDVYLDASHPGTMLHTFPIETYFAELGNNNTIYTFEGYTTRVILQNIGSRIMNFSEIIPMAGSYYYYYGSEEGAGIGLELLEEL